MVKSYNQRPPIVAVLGHVDHGKTTLLDTIRKTNVAGKEAGGITQNVSASQVTTKEGKITFIDTPGHEAFNSMRQRGAKIADFALLVVAADDGVKPQTQESLAYIKETKLPFIVVLTKTELTTADEEKVKKQLETEGVLFEGRGGDTPVISISAKADKGVEELVEIVFLFSELQEAGKKLTGELKASVLETSKDKRGALVTAVIKDGKLSVSDEIEADGLQAKAKGLFDSMNRPQKSFSAGEPVWILGFKELPTVGSMIVKAKGAKGVEVKAATYSREAKDTRAAILVKAKNAGSLEAVIGSLPGAVGIVSASIGDVTENDVLLAKSTGAAIFVFESKVTNSILNLARNESVSIKRFEIIYEFVEAVKEYLDEGKEKEAGRATILAVFPYNDQKVAGAKVTSGEFKKGDSLVLVRDEKEVGRARAISLRIQKRNVEAVRKGEEFGVLMTPQLDFQEGDVLVSLRNG